MGPQALLGLVGMMCFAVTGEDPDPNFWLNLSRGLAGTLCYAVIGIALGTLSFKIFDWLTPRIDVEKELGEKHNLAVAIVCGALILGICYITAQAIK